MGTVTEWTQQEANATTGAAWNYRYDGTNQLTVASRTGLSGNATAEESRFSYDFGGNRIGVQTEAGPRKSTFNTVNELLSESDGGLTAVKGAVDEPSVVKVNGRYARMITDTEFEADTDTVPGANTFSVEAKDGAGNTRTQQFEFTVATGAAARNFQYDRNGNLIDDGVRRYTWDALNRLVGIEYVGTDGTTTFTYDGLNRRVGIVEKTGETVTADRRFVWDGLAIRQERNATNTVLKHFSEFGFRLGSATSQSIAVYHGDHLGSVRAVTNQNGSITGQFAYDAWGNSVRTYGIANPDFRYTGHFHHARSGLTLAPFRAYDSVTGRWLSRDPIGEKGGINLYGYVLNNPLNAVDPLGLEDLNLFNNGVLGIGREPLRKYVTRAPDDKKTYTVGGHGNESSILDGNRDRTITPKELADRIRKDPDFKNAEKVTLYSCSTGKGSNSFAEQLAKELGKPVTAPTDILWMGPDGSHFVAPPVNPSLPVNQWKPDMTRPGSMVTFP